METFKYAAPVAGALGYSVQDTSLAIGLMANSGIKASQAGTALRAGLTNLVKPTDSMAAMMEKYGISIENSDGKMKSFKEVMSDLREKMGGLDEATQASAVATIFGKILCHLI
ncbi:phage tail tape measure protein [Paraclostridium sordellii]|uniref:Phage tail tape measure protein n=1 Tax=Paraclostridium sordellii TaxID=1505 RepID=A0A9P1P9F8_PARSO|nr:phage tail tape measure protein [Paeniclostridium sordellii]CEO32974.1 phage tail tape measure protein [[Clostridium] sordellii] [Paeniclostridium sordellii]